jgi:regulator of sigma E protease
MLDPNPRETIGTWFKTNAVQLIVIAAAAVLILRYLHPLDVLLAGFGLSFIIFIHELGHFLAAKFCDVHVKTFSIGFGPALPFCSYKYGETTYKLALIPLGGFVAMVGEADGNNLEVQGDEPEEAKTDPRSLKEKTVLQRMLIVSAGVIMNILLAGVLFIVAYMHGVEESPGIIARVDTGSAAWKAGIHSGTEIRRMNSRANPFFDDIKPMVFSTSRSDTVSMDLDYQGKITTLEAEPYRLEGGLAPQLGIAPLTQMKLIRYKRDVLPPYEPGSVFSQAKAADGGAGFLHGDKIIAMTDPARPNTVTTLDPKPNGLPGEYFDYVARQKLLLGKPITYHVTRYTTDSEPMDQTPIAVTVPAAYHRDMGLRMRMGEIVAVRRDSPAAKADIQVRTPDYKKMPIVPGDTIVSVEIPEAEGRTTLFTIDPTTTSPMDPKSTIRPLDPMRLPYDLDLWLERPAPSRKVKLTVLRTIEHGPQRKTLELDWDNTYSNEIPAFMNPGTSMAINGLGLAYQVLTVVNAVQPFQAGDTGVPSAAAKAGLQANDKITEIRVYKVDHEGKDIPAKFEKVGVHQWAFIDYTVQQQAPHKIEVKFERDGQELTAMLEATPDTSWPVMPWGLNLTMATVVQKADGIVEALQMGGYRTYRGIRMTYQGMYGIIFGDVSVKSMSGPITLGRISYLIAGQDVWHLIIWMAMISINLAVVNFMPIPVLDGGHMVFLIYEGIRGKRPPQSVEVILTYMGLACVGCLMLFVFGLDIWRYFFQ